MHVDVGMHIYIYMYIYVYIERDIKAEQHECKRTYNASQIPRALRHVGASNLHLRTEVFTGSGENKRHAEPVHGMQFSDRGRPSSRRGLAPWKPRIFDFGRFVGLSKSSMFRFRNLRLWPLRPGCGVLLTPASIASSSGRPPH